MRLVNATVLGNLVSAHYEHDEKKFAAYVQFIIDAYEERGENAVIDTSKESMNLDSTVVSENQEGLAKRIQDKIQEKYANAVITSFDTANLTGTFESDTGDYGFSWSDNMLEIFNLENKDQNVYYKVSAFYEVD